MSDEQREMMEEQREAQRHNANLQRPGEDDKTPETLKYISQPEEEIESPTEALEWINTKSASTANLSDADVESKPWILEYHQLLSRMEHPPEYGLSGHLRAWAYDDSGEYREALDPQEMLDTEGFAEVGKLALTRSKDGWGVETATKDTKESIVRDGDNKAGGLLGKLRR